MIKSQLLLALRSLKSRKLRTALTILGVALGVGVIFATQITIVSTLAAFDNMVSAVAGKADLLISYPGGDGISQATIKKIKQLPGVKLVGASIMGTDLLRRSVPKEKRRSVPITIIGIDPKIDSQLREYRFFKGSFFKSKKEVVIPRQLSQEHNLTLGKKIKLQGVNSQPTYFKIVGLLSDSGAGRITNGQVVFTSLTAARRLFKINGYSNLDVDLKASANIKQVKAKIKQLHKSLIVEEPASRVEAKKKFLNLLNIGLIFFGTIALFVGAFLVLNTFNMIVKEQTRELGLLRCLGASRRQSSGYILTQAVIVGLVGALIGLVVGYFLSDSLISYVEKTVQGSTGTGLMRKSGPFVKNLITAFLIGFIFTLLAVLRPAYKASTLSPLIAVKGMDAINPKARARAFLRWSLPLIFLPLGFFLNSTAVVFWRQDLIQRQVAIFFILLGIIGLLPLVVKFFFSAMASLAKKLKQPMLMLATGNLLGNPERTATTSSATMVTVTMLIIIGGLLSSFQKAVNQWVDTSVKADIFVATDDLNITLPQKVVKKLTKITAIKDLTTVRFFPVQTKEGLAVTFRAIDPLDFQKFSNFQFVKGNEKMAWLKLKKGRAVFISSVTANKHKLKVGQRLNLLTNQGVKSFFIAAEVVDFAGELGGLVVGTQADAKKFFNIKRISSVRIKLKANENVKKAVKKVEKVLKGYNVRVEDLANFKKRVNKEVAVTFGVFNVLGLLAFVVAVLSIFNTLMINIFERQKDLAVLRATGLSRWQLSKMLTLEAVFMGLLGGIIGQVVGLILAKNLVTNMTKISGHSLNFVMPTNSLYLAVFLTFIFSLLAAIYPAYKAGRLDLTKAIQYE